MTEIKVIAAFSALLTRCFRIIRASCLPQYFNHDLDILQDIELIQTSDAISSSKEIQAQIHLYTNIRELL